MSGMNTHTAPGSAAPQVLPLAIAVNGEPWQGAGWPLDRGLHYGDGLFETLRVRAGRPRFVALHRQRLSEGLRRLHITDVDEPALWDEVHALAAQYPQSLLKLLVTRGDAVARGYAPGAGQQSRRVLLAYAPPAPPPQAADAITLRAQLGENSLLAGLKHTNRLEQVLACAELGTRAFEGLLGSSSGWLVSGTMSNVYLRIDGNWLTPRLNRCGVAAVLRAVALREAAIAGPLIQQADIPFAHLRDCEAACVSNSRFGLLPLDTLDGRRLLRDSAIDALAAQVEQLDD
jgi:4-amino-4-deoxychorismate lyase